MVWRPGPFFKRTAQSGYRVPGPGQPAREGVPKGASSVTISVFYGFDGCERGGGKDEVDNLSGRFYLAV